jgi:putative transposase
MSNLFQNKYRIPSYRAAWWDYANQGNYFITICTHRRIHFFGRVKNAQVDLSPIGLIVQEEWLKTLEIRTDMNLALGAFVVMPNHFHAIISIGENQYQQQLQDQHRFCPQKKNISSIVRGFKSAVSKRARLINEHFAWQARFHDHIIRDPRAYDAISNYIQQNPRKWQEDRFFGL